MRSSTRRYGARAARFLAGAGLLAAMAAAATARAAADGVLAAIETAPVVVIAEVRDVESLVHAGYRATLAVERSLHPGLSPGDTVTVAWEEPTPSRPARLAVGRRVLAAAGPLPTASIWRMRVPDDEARASLLGLAGGGEGYVERPSAVEIDVIEHALRAGAEARRGDAGVLYLSRLAAVGQPRLARDAAARLGDFSQLGEHLTAPAASAFVDALVRGDLPELREPLLGLIDAHRPEALGPPLRARIAASEPSVPPVLYLALGTLEGGLDDNLAVPLLQAGSVEARTAAARQASGPLARELLRELLREDTDPAVRAAAVTRLVELDGAGALPEATGALADPAPEVRLAAVRGSASVDPEAVEPLRDVALRGSPDAARAAIAALSLMGAEAHVLLAEFAAAHPDAAIRTLARIAIGEPVGHEH